MTDSPTPTVATERAAFRTAAADAPTEVRVRAGSRLSVTASFDADRSRVTTVVESCGEEDD